MMDEISRQDLASVSYSEAVAHYNQQKHNFLQEYKRTAGDLDDKVVGQYLAEAFAEIRQNPIEGQSDIINNIIGDVGVAIKEKISNKPGYIKQLKNDFNTKYEQNIEKAREAFKQEAQELLSAEELYNIIMERLSSLGTKEDLQGFQPEDILNQMRSFTVKILLNRAQGYQGNRGQGRYKNIGKGYVREAAVHKVFLKLINHIDDNDRYIMHTGATKIGGKDTGVDEFISFINNIAENYFITAAISDGEALPEYKGYGIQSKSLIAPWEQDNTYNKYGYSVGTRTGLLKSLQSEGPITYHDWTRCICFLARLNNTVAALGPNVFYVTGKNLYWTSQLIQKMHQANYFLTFNFSAKKHAATAHVVWDTPNDK